MGRVPRRAHWRTRPFFWPIRASSWNQISTGVVSADAVEMSLQRAREVFLNASTIRSSCAGWRGLALMWEKPIFFRSVPT